MVFTVNNLVAFLGWIAGGRVLAALFRGERAGRRLDLFFALLLTVVAVRMAWPSSS